MYESYQVICGYRCINEDRIIYHRLYLLEYSLLILTDATTDRHAPVDMVILLVLVSLQKRFMRYLFMTMWSRVCYYSTLYNVSEILT